MNEIPSIERLSEISQIIIKDEIDYLELKEALNSFKELLLEISEMTNEDLNNRDNIYLDSGKAIAPEWAIRCVDDLLRTKRFICGVYKAVLKVKEQSDKKPIYILYTGTGPFATLVLPLITLFSPEEIQFILVEINTISYEQAKKVFKAFNAEAYINEFHQADAATLKLDSPERIDIHVVECLQHALAREPQVTITYNIISQLKRSAILIPQNIELSILQINPNLHQEHMMNTNSEKILKPFLIKSEPVYALNKDEVLNSKALDENGQLIFPKKVISIDNPDSASFSQLAIGTDITVFEDERLGFAESGLTIPKIIGYQREGQRINAVETQYINSNDPELTTKFIH
ncbi:MAG: hypothetical protein HKN09_10005 [Saprospiraceae bacterium]|nr:hypothetical protein [Saprospiraceae bacterium]